MKIKVSELIGAALNWAVAKCEGFYGHADYRPTTNWAQGGPIIDREDITWSMHMLPEYGDDTRFCAFSYRIGSSKAQNGPTKLIAAMRCYVASKLGDEVDVPEELL